ncbi:hypothetical protein AYI69_g6344 [Smittium culicis]|uniref:HTH tetR-type domain-containing protein n=1 Tax=Smittium culicis TaxID=133412 RepID=A0A1R1XZI0_9FUNG|nr:hypothetical protein AYI69_g6344 [Smittium culicis]
MSTRRFATSARGKNREILDLALGRVNEYGWEGSKSISSVCEEMGLSKMAYTMCYNNGTGLIQHFFNKSLAETITATEMHKDQLASKR